VLGHMTCAFVRHGWAWLSFLRGDLLCVWPLYMTGFTFSEVPSVF